MLLDDDDGLSRARRSARAVPPSAPGRLS